MAEVFPNYILVICLLALLVGILFGTRRVAQVRSPRNTALIIVICSFVLMPMQVWYLFDLPSYDVGNPVVTDSISLAPLETHTTVQISNWYTVTYIPMSLICSNNVTFYFTDENRPETRYEEGNYTDATIQFRLPYKNTGLFELANWTGHFLNPSLNQTIDVTYYQLWIPNGAWHSARWYVEYIYYMPAVIILTLWIFMGGATLWVSTSDGDRQRVLMLLSFLGLPLLILSVAHLLFAWTPVIQIALFCVIPVLIISATKICIRSIREDLRENV
jgi:hypothetical protein